MENVEITKIEEKNKKLGVLNEEEIKFLSTISGFLDKTSMGMTDIQIKKFVLNRVEFPTDFFVYKQAKTEIWVRFENLVNLFFDFEKTKGEIEMLKAEKLMLDDTPVGRAEKRLKEIEIERKSFQLNVSKKVASEKIREAKSFYEAYEELKAFDDIPKEEIERLEQEGWLTKAKTDESGRLKAYFEMGV